jgi:hypothetical protein
MPLLTTKYPHTVPGYRISDFKSVMNKLPETIGQVHIKTNYLDW